MQPSTLPPPALHEDYSLRMSLALDGLLADDEQAELNAHLAACPACHTAWLKWQHIGHIMTVEPFAGPRQNLVLGVDRALRRAELLKERLLAALLVSGGTVAILVTVLFSAALFTGGRLLLSPTARVEVGETVNFVRQFIALLAGNLATVRDAVLVTLPSPALLLPVAVLLMLAAAAWAQLVFRSALLQSNQS